MEKSNTEAKKRVLILTYYWPPSGGSGVQRWLKFAKYLPEFGWEPIIYTAENPEYPVIDTSLEAEVPEGLTVLKQPIFEPYDFYKKFMGQKKSEKIQTGFITDKKLTFKEKLARFIRGNFFIPDARILWVRPSVAFLSKWIKENPVDVIISTSPPQSIHLIGLTLKKMTGLPWMADFRDPWTRVFYFDELRLTPVSGRKHLRLEKQVLSSADKVLVTSRDLATDFKSLYNRDYSLLTNGFDKEVLGHEAPTSPDPEFVISHIGSFMPTMNHLALWTALKEIWEEIPGFRDDFRLRLIGKVDQSVKAAITSAGLEGNLELVDYVPHAEVIKLQQRSQVLLLSLPKAPNADLVVPGKLFEYMASGRPVLCLSYPGGHPESIVESTQCGRVASFEDKEKIKEIVLKYYQAYKGEGLKSKSIGIEKYSRRGLTQSLSEILFEISPSPKH